MCAVFSAYVCGGLFYEVELIGIGGSVDCSQGGAEEEGGRGRGDGEEVGECGEEGGGEGAEGEEGKVGRGGGGGMWGGGWVGEGGRRWRKG